MLHKVKLEVEELFVVNKGLDFTLYRAISFAHVP